jgi:hypothetical protein
MFVQQTALILRIKAKPIRLEMSDYAVEVNNGREVQDVVSQLSTIHHLYAAIIPVWQHGDISNRSRLFIVGTLEADTKADYMSDIKFKFQEPTISAAEAGTYRMIAVPDAEVPEEYWLKDQSSRVPWKPSEGGKMHIIARRGYGMGHRDNSDKSQGIYLGDSLRALNWD